MSTAPSPLLMLGTGKIHLCTSSKVFSSHQAGVGRGKFKKKCFNKYDQDCSTHSNKNAYIPKRRYTENVKYELLFLYGTQHKGSKSY